MQKVCIFHTFHFFLIKKKLFIRSSLFCKLLFTLDEKLTELVPAVIINLEDGQTHATISPLLCIIASPTKIALSLS